MTRLIVSVKLYEYMTRHPEPDGWDNGDYRMSYEGCRVYLDRYPDEWAGNYRNEFYVDYPVTPNGCVFPVLARYSTGSTFGRSDGNIVAVGVYQNIVDATDVETAIWADYREPKSGFSTLEVAGTKIYTGTWKGYFEYLEDVFVEPAVVRA